MKIYLHGPRKGQTVKIRDIQFNGGMAEYPCLLKTLEKYYGVKDYPPDSQESEVSADNEQKDNVDISFEVSAQDVEEFKPQVGWEQEDKTEDEDQKILNKVIEEKKAELNKEKSNIKDWKAMPWWTAKAYVKEMTGKSPKNKKSALAIMKEAGFE